MSNWRHVWVRGIQPQISWKGLEALRAGLAEDDPALHNRLNESVAVGRTHSIIISCDPVTYPRWRGDGVTDPVELRRGWLDVMNMAAVRLDCCVKEVFDTFYDGFWDTAERRDAFALLLEEVEKALGLVPAWH
jgi:hypothetical protein